MPKIDIAAVPRNGHLVNPLDLRLAGVHLPPIKAAHAALGITMPEGSSVNSFRRLLRKFLRQTRAQRG